MRNQRYLGVIVGVVAGVVVLRVLGVSLGSVALSAVVLACPLMMFFMMRGMAGMGSGGRDDDSQGRPGPTS
jgi:hypothetical protein